MKDRRQARALALIALYQIDLRKDGDSDEAGVDIARFVSAAEENRQGE